MDGGSKSAKDPSELFQKIKETDMNSISHIKLILAIAALISSAEAQATKCGTSSPECCWVVQSWQLFGKTTNVNPTSTNGCCSMPGVRCHYPSSTQTNVTHIDWFQQSLSRPIPSSMGNLKSLSLL